MTSSLTTALEEMTINNEQLRRENDILKSDIMQLRTDNDAMKNEIIQVQGNNDKQKDEIGQLTTLLDKMAVTNQKQTQQINSQSSENTQLRTEVQQLKVSQCSGITCKHIIAIYIVSNIVNHFMI